MTIKPLTKTYLLGVLSFSSLSSDKSSDRSSLLFKFSLPVFSLVSEQDSLVDVVEFNAVSLLMELELDSFASSRMDDVRLAGSLPLLFATVSASISDLSLKTSPFVKLFSSLLVFLSVLVDDVVAVSYTHLTLPTILLV